MSLKMGECLFIRWILISFIVTHTWISILARSKDKEPKYLTSKCSKSVLLEIRDKKEATYSWHPKAEVPGYHCLWTVAGSKSCPITMKCKLELQKISTKNCTESPAWVKVSDGSGGEKIYCGETTFTARPSHTDLRDIFVKINVSANYTGRKGVKCDAACDWKKDAPALPKNIVKNIDTSCVCGLQTNQLGRIIGGDDSKMNEFPWQAAIVFNGTRSPTCGASVINSQWILSAAHCFYYDKRGSDKINILLHAHTLDMTKKKSAKNVALGKAGSVQSSGWNESRKTDKDENSQRFKIAEVINHPLFNEDYDYDFALLRLERKIDFGNPDSPQPICLPPPNVFDSFSKVLVGQNLTVTGWGLQAENAGGTTRILQKLDVPYISDQQCVKTNRLHVITPRMLCAGHLNGTKQDACTGDSGGPLFFKQNNSQHMQVGVVSWGDGCARKGKPGIYAKLTEVMQWVLFHTGEHDAKWCQERKQ